MAERGLLVTADYLTPLRETLALMTPPSGMDAPTCVVYATRTAAGLGGGNSSGVEVVRIPAGFAPKNSAGKGSTNNK